MIKVDITKMIIAGVGDVSHCAEFEKPASIGQTGAGLAVLFLIILDDSWQDHLVLGTYGCWILIGRSGKVDYVFSDLDNLYDLDHQAHGLGKRLKN